MEDFDWVEDINPLNIRRTSNNEMKYNPVLTDDIFNEVKGLCTKLWGKYDNQFGYVDEKMDEVNSLPKTWTSVIKMIRMFHVLIQRRLFERFSTETNESIKLEMYDRGWSHKDF